MTEVVTANNLTKHFGSFKALDGMNFTVSSGSICGLIGPNGAGKTTTLKALVGLSDVDGDLTVAGRDPRASRHKLMEEVCFIADVGILPKWFKVKQVLDYVAAVHPKFSRERAEQILSSTDILANKRIGELSKGMVTQLHLALVMAIDVQLLVLDEPTLGLDIIYRKEFYDRLLNDYYDGNCTIIISTHQVEEIETLLSDLLFIDKGKIVLDAPMHELENIYTEVLVDQVRYPAAEGLNPIYQRDVLGKKAYIFEGVARENLAHLGDMATPAVADLFVAKLRGGARE